MLHVVTWIQNSIDVSRYWRLLIFGTGDTFRNVMKIISFGYPGNTGRRVKVNKTVAESTVERIQRMMLPVAR